ncbi:glycosyltransferase family 4 protein [Halorubrum lipolyticum]|uniref:LPS glycosyltransferase n=1 Tax=Halorubrum lipolyticum DSM 21995 TaxID=1227482 RepID=M0P1H9_9EURY|nr:glycosyltransferase family 4 protein [Halorubrum lipolyticum]EMA63703.1 LPS glycosyltransferase [Halorubrum lipolyticum DSM 21995]
MSPRSLPSTAAGAVAAAVAVTGTAATVIAAVAGALDRLARGAFEEPDADDASEAGDDAGEAGDGSPAPDAVAVPDDGPADGRRAAGRPGRLLVVGASSGATGGVGQYITEQRKHLAGDTALHNVASPDGSGTRWFVAAAAKAVADAARFVVRDRPDLVHVHCSHDYSFVRESFYVLFGRYAWRRPVVLHVHGSSFDEFVRTDSRLLGAYQSLVFDAACRVIVLSTYWKEAVSRRVDPASVAVVPNAVDPSEYDAEGEDDAVDGEGENDDDLANDERATDGLHVVFLSNLIERKGVSEFLDALETLDETDSPPYHATIAGKGPYSDAVERFAADRPHVAVAGYVSESEKRALLSAGDVYVLPSHAEGLPIAILEAMAGGNAIVSTTVGSIPETVGPENGRTVPPGDADALAEAIRELIAEPESTARMGRTNRELVAERYSWEVVTAELREVYASCLAEGAS